ncbi:MAG: RNA polymerase sigma factor [Bacteroidales bacterium]|jgi:RNA polymerase sigma-70 factor (ECF subfamily)|nr:RNA polymerase sigma factor [Bacteroidales bacterium]MBQ6100869.1 RNA polymerase sigma factor [Bacteroidales bacterium]
MTTEEFKRNILKMQPRLQRMAEYIVGDPDSAADAVQEAVIALWEQRSTIKSQEIEKLSLTVVKRRSIDLLRKQKPTVDIDAESLMLAEPPQDNLEERYRMARQLVDRLPARQRNVILMKYEEGLSMEEIEKATGMSSTHVYATLSRAYKSLRETIKQYKEE